MWFGGFHKGPIQMEAAVARPAVARPARTGPDYPCPRSSLPSKDASDLTVQPAKVELQHPDGAQVVLVALGSKSDSRSLLGVKVAATPTIPGFRKANKQLGQRHASGARRYIYGPCLERRHRPKHALLDVFVGLHESSEIEGHRHRFGSVYRSMSRTTADVTPFDASTAWYASA